jgi:hypothetical protein
MGITTASALHVALDSMQLIVQLLNSLASFPEFVQRRSGPDVVATSALLAWGSPGQYKSPLARW